MKKVLIEVTIIVAAAAAFTTTGCSKNNDYSDIGNPIPTVNAQVISGSGDSAGIVSKLDEFRVLAGTPLNTAPGAATGRREVNWDAVPPAFTNGSNFPFNFFGSADPAAANGRKRGLILANSGSNFRVDSTDFSEIDPSYASQFEAFSRKRLFASVGTNITEVSFKVPGTDVPAFVKSFGVIFSDVDDANTTVVQYFSGPKSLGVYKAKPAAQGFSFVGVAFPDDKVTKVKIISGTGVLSTGVKDITDGGYQDLVVMDDFLYDEPKQLN